MNVKLSENKVFLEKQFEVSFSDDVTKWDEKIYWNLVSDKLTKEQEKTITDPDRIFDSQKEVLAVHWHPEMVPISDVKKRIKKMFPQKEKELIIPTQHNQLMSYEDFSGVEVDCFSPEFNRKVQLLFHFENKKLKHANTFKSMLDHTFQYRSGQFFELIDSLVEQRWIQRRQLASGLTGTDNETIEIVAKICGKLKKLIDQRYVDTPKNSIKNKLIPNFIFAHSSVLDAKVIQRALFFVKEVKKIVKANFSLEYFYNTQDVIEEVRSLEGGIIVPHPEQFWPILLANYDVDGYEVWNPQSREFTEFLIKVVIEKNKNKQYRKKPLLVFTGDDCHLGAKLNNLGAEDPEKTIREIGYQPIWDDMQTLKAMRLGNFTKSSIIDEYLARLK